MWLYFTPDEKSDGPSFAVPLTVGETTIGSGKGADIALYGDRISRRHLMLTSFDGEVTFRDLASVSGTLLNGEKKDSGRLKEGDKLTLGSISVELITELPSKGSVKKRSRAKEESAANEKSAAMDKQTHSPTHAQSKTHIHSKTVDWFPYKEFMDKLRASIEPRDLLEHLLQGLVEHLGAKRGFVLLKPPKSERLVPVATYSLADTEEFLSVSSTVYKKAITTRQTVYIANSWKDDSCKGATSILSDEKPRSILCGPLRVRGEDYGVVYVDAQMGDIAKRHAHAFATMTDFAAELVAAARTRKALLAAHSHLTALNSLVSNEDELVLGNGEGAKSLRKSIERAASQDVTVLIRGETGTGKEMVARQLHRLSQRKDGPFVAVNSAALPPEMVEAELFGAEKGAYTGATERRIGRFELASGGTLFLDEIGDIPLNVQVALLRVLQERKLRRLGGHEVIPLDFRLLCATNVNLEEAVKEGTFRQDLFYRINVFEMSLLPLRERNDDLLPLAHHFLSIFSRRFRKNITGFTGASEKALLAYEWPGNVRELRNVIERATLVEDETLVGPASLRINASTPTNSSDSDDFAKDLPDDYEGALEVFDRIYLKRAIEKSNGKMVEVARLTGLARSSLYRKLEKLGLMKK